MMDGHIHIDERSQRNAKKRQDGERFIIENPKKECTTKDGVSLFSEKQGKREHARDRGIGALVYYVETQLQRLEFRWRGDCFAIMMLFCFSFSRMEV